MIIQRIVRFREDSAKLLQKNIRNFIYRQKVKKILLKLQKYYSVYPSNEPNFNISLKLFIDNRNPLIYKIFPIRFCKVRKCYVFDIPKNKFPSHKKIMRFIFIIDNNERIDEAYKSVLFGEELVNQIDFKLYDKKIERLSKFYNNIKKGKLKTNNNIINKNRFSKRRSFAESDYNDSDEDYIQRSASQSLSKTFRSAFRYGNKNLNKRDSKESINTLTSNLFSDNESSDISLLKKKNKGKRRHSRSILKKKSRSSTNFFGGQSINKKKVSFGIVQYSY